MEIFLVECVKVIPLIATLIKVQMKTLSVDNSLRNEWSFKLTLIKTCNNWYGNVTAHNWRISRLGSLDSLFLLWINELYHNCHWVSEWFSRVAMWNKNIFYLSAAVLPFESLLQYSVLVVSSRSLIKVLRKTPSSAVTLTIHYYREHQLLLIFTTHLPHQHILEKSALLQLKWPEWN